MTATGGCTGSSLDEFSSEQEVVTVDPGIQTRSGPNYFLTGTDRDAILTNCMLDFVLRGGNSVYTIALHGAPSVIQALPAPGAVAASGAQTVVVASCYGGTSAPGDESIAQFIARTEGIPCTQVIGCTGSVYPKCGPNWTTAMPDGSTTPGIPELYCDGTWVNGCVPPTAVAASIPGVSMTTPGNFAPSAPIPGAVTVGCFAGDLPSDVWRRCRNVYNNYVPPGGGTCADVWNELPSHPRKQTCDALVRLCIQNTNAACAAIAPPPPPPAAPPPGQVAVGDGGNGSNGSGFNGSNGSGDQLVYGGSGGSNGSNTATP